MGRVVLLAWSLAGPLGGVAQAQDAGPPAAAADSGPAAQEGAAQEGAAQEGAAQEGAAQEGAAPGAPPGPAATGARIPVHVGVFDPNTPSARTMAGDVARLAGRAAGARPGLKVTQDPPETWLTEAHFKHEGALLACMDPWFTRREVLNCLQLLPFPAMPPERPRGIKFLLDGRVQTVEAGLLVSMSLHPVVDGWVGPPVLTREVTLTRRMRKLARDAALARALEEVLNFVEGLPPPEEPRRPARGRVRGKGRRG